ncbi:isochorismatase family protein [Pseudolysinimonas sp.]|uniref:cysteine hydrolase family protein n=1 Tax=Pseudolysinimonas sp. TaxID=2680009 RepID=UPI00286AB11B|nr:isochorismatase family protein [Pseudolysinimonas sp.]
MTRLDHSVVPATHVAGTTPYPWPWNGDLDPRGTAVAVVTERGFPHPHPAGEAARVAASEVVETVRAAGGVVLLIETTPPAGAASRGVGSVDPAPLAEGADHVVSAVGLDGFFGSPLEALLRSLRLERLVLVGTGLETSVHSTMRSANDRGFECLLVVDACTPHDAALVAASVSMIEMSGGIFGAVGSARAVVEAFTEQGREKR